MTPITDIDFDGAPERALEALIASRFAVSPARAFGAYEDFEFLDGEIARLTVHTFVMQVRHLNDLKGCADAMWSDIKQAWPPGTFLMWRKYPEFTWDGTVGMLRLRIGAFIPPARAQFVKVEGGEVKKWKPPAKAAESGEK